VLRQRRPAGAPAVVRHLRRSVVAGMTPVTRIGIFLLVFGFAFAIGCRLASIAGIPCSVDAVTVVFLAAVLVASLIAGFASP
jgi:hypothetical protein